jgi:hypothetical protein
MKTQVIANPLISSNMQSSVMGMDAKGADMATYYLRDKIYSNKVLAVVREYVCNAVDEHKKHNISRPIDFGIRGAGENSEFFVRDYAKGLSEEDIRNVFGMYFRSTKSNSNDQIGGFGIGSKAAHCYTDTFYVKSFHNGVCSLYVCALGGGSTGIPVGHILKVSECDTTESGLEISLELTKPAVYSFNNVARSFIENFSSKIVYHYYSEQVLPQEELGSVEKNGFKFRFYKSDARVPLVRFAMGDVIYENNTFHNPKAQLLKKTLVIDIPIGKMTLPISRESFESTPQNEAVKKKALETLDEVINEDIASIPAKTILELLTDAYNPELHGEFFSIAKRILYKDVYPFIQTFLITGDYSKDFEKHNGKIICAVAKSSKTNYWFDKLNNHAIINNKKYYLTYQSVLDQCNLVKLSEVFEFRTVKSKIFNWPVSEGGKKTLSMNDAYVVNIKNPHHGYYDKASVSPLDLYNRLAVLWQMDSVDSIEEAKESMSEIEFNSLKKLESFSVKRSTFTSNCSTTVTASKAMHSNLIELGFFDVDSQEYRSKREEIAKKECAKAVEAQIVHSMNKKFLQQEHSDKLFAKAQRNFKFAKKAASIFDKIFAEQSIRGKILKSVESSSGYWSSFNPRLSREELRKILLLK